MGDYRYRELSYTNYLPYFAHLLSGQFISEMKKCNSSVYDSCNLKLIKYSLTTFPCVKKFIAKCIQYQILQTCTLTNTQLYCTIHVIYCQAYEHSQFFILCIDGCQVNSLILYLNDQSHQKQTLCSIILRPAIVISNKHHWWIFGYVRESSIRFSSVLMKLRQ